MNLWGSIVIASVLIGLSRGRAVSYEELISLKAQCHPIDTCKNTTENIDPSIRSCECDDSCAFYGDCCLDARNRQAMETMKTRNICLKKNNYLGYFAVSNCKRNWRDLETKRKCEENPNAEDPYTLIPVMSQRSKITYRNRYCASCNEDNKDLDFWKIGVTCSQLGTNLSYDFQNDLVYNSRLRTWGMRLPNETFVSCNLEPVPPENTQHLRSCYSHTINTCSPNWKDDFIREKCESYTAVILSNHETKYRNVHCAICNGVNVMNLDCPKIQGRISVSGAPNIVCLFSVGNCTCENKVQDKAFGKCRELTCGLPFLELRDGKCVRKS